MDNHDFRRRRDRYVANSKEEFPVCEIASPYCACIRKGRRVTLPFQKISESLRHWSAGHSSFFTGVGPFFGFQGWLGHFESLLRWSPCPCVVNFARWIYFEPSRGEIEPYNLNHIEHVWSTFKSALEKSQLTTLKELHRAITREWDRLDPSPARETHGIDAPPPFGLPASQGRPD